MTQEKRYIEAPVEVRAGDGSMTIVGHASTFDTPYDLLGFREQVSRGAFKKTIKDKTDVAALWNHDPNVVLGSRGAGTLRLSEDDRGLYYEVDINPEDSDARNVFARIKRGDVTKSSFAFEVVKETWDYPKEKNSDELPLRTIKEVRLFDVSPVTYPASDATQVDVARAARSLAEAIGVDPADTVPEVLARMEESTPEPPEPVEDHSDTPEPERTFKPLYIA